MRGISGQEQAAIAFELTGQYPNTDTQYSNQNYSEYPNAHSQYAQYSNYQYSNADSQYPNTDSQYPQYPNTDSQYPNMSSQYTTNTQHPNTSTYHVGSNNPSCPPKPPSEIVKETKKPAVSEGLLAIGDYSDDE